MTLRVGDSLVHKPRSGRESNRKNKDKIHTTKSLILAQDER